MRNSCTSALALCVLLSCAMHCSGQSPTEPVSVRGNVNGGPGGPLDAYSVDLAGVAGAKLHEYFAAADLSGHFVLPQVPRGDYSFRVRNDLGRWSIPGSCGWTGGREVDRFASARRTEGSRTRHHHLTRLTHGPRPRKRSFSRGSRRRKRGS